MQTLNTLEDVLASGRVMWTYCNENDDHISAHWSPLEREKDEPVLDAYCAELRQRVMDMFNESDQQDKERLFAFSNGIVNGVTYITADWSNITSTLTLLDCFMKGMKKAIMETFHPEIEVERQKMIQAELDKPHVVHKAIFDENGKLTLTRGDLSPS